MSTLRSIILEGPNGAGKSALAKALQDRLGLQYVHAGTSPKSIRKACNDQLRQLRRGVILDRCTPISERIYHRNSIMSNLYMGYMLYKMLNFGVIIYCTGNGDIVSKPYYDKNHEKRIHDDRDSIRCKYRNMMLGIPCIKYDFELDDIDKILYNIRAVVYV